MKEGKWLHKKVSQLKAEVELQRRCHVDEENQPAVNSLDHILDVIDELFVLDKPIKINVHGYCVICEKPILDNQIILFYDGKVKLHTVDGNDAHEECIKEKDKETYDSMGVPPNIIGELRSTHYIGNIPIKTEMKKK